MSELWISASGEVKLDYDVVGQITWAPPIAHLRVEGEWDQCGGDLCWDCGGLIVSQASFDDMEDERNELKSERDQLIIRMRRLRAQLSEARNMLGVEP